MQKQRKQPKTQDINNDMQELYALRNEIISSCKEAKYFIVDCYKAYPRTLVTLLLFATIAIVNINYKHSTINLGGLQASTLQKAKQLKVTWDNIYDFIGYESWVAVEKTKKLSQDGIIYRNGLIQNAVKYFSDIGNTPISKDYIFGYFSYLNTGKIANNQPKHINNLQPQVKVVDNTEKTQVKIQPTLFSVSTYTANSQLGEEDGAFNPIQFKPINIAEAVVVFNVGGGQISPPSINMISDLLGKIRTDGKQIESVSIYGYAESKPPIELS